MIQLIKIPEIENVFGNLAVIEKDTIPFEIKRVYFMYDIPSIAKRGGHAHKNLKQILIAISGSFDVVLKNGVKTEKVTLNKPNVGLLIENFIWSDLENFSSGAVCLVIASDTYLETDYIRNYNEFLECLK
ncbi:hypothetical protein B0A58_05665 [Flavobacterium branchiophilum NBRC 15030 = ATCC 35035]|uniref:WxcM-like protein n=1 Tax=Flavobacterium branchiophilum TaxID=55197 RepID=A0A543G127_9FLAO|nr:FdtA/QdtA family cupin domain-containing protein [Flavobacterium branchiophilum]OXA77443.1 hypothetical protein B0A58_05665 [Flavobacterium branchiophilum NBRC 15030 = ATCC 35035]TQM39714.1 WxcM-like protein [Flavobacterium branchiophilum]GEM55619.1 hypothetical protein FB1_18400 [Flavobacterium branchiophilum NBRC 15030 = ATCC 35035]